MPDPTATSHSLTPSSTSACGATSMLLLSCSPRSPVRSLNKPSNEGPDWNYCGSGGQLELIATSSIYKLN